MRSLRAVRSSKGMFWYQHPWGSLFVPVEAQRLQEPLDGSWSWRRHQQPTLLVWSSIHYGCIPASRTTRKQEVLPRTLPTQRFRCSDQRQSEPEYRLQPLREQSNTTVLLLPSRSGMVPVLRCAQSLLDSRMVSFLHSIVDDATWAASGCDNTRLIQTGKPKIRLRVSVVMNRVLQVPMSWH